MHMLVEMATWKLAKKVLIFAIFSFLFAFQLDSVCGKFCEGPSGRTVLPWNKTDNVSYFTSFIVRCILGTTP